MKPRALIMPRDKGAGSLDVVIAVMAFLASLALGAMLIAERAAVTWRSGLAGRITVQVLPPETSPVPLPVQIDAALHVLRETPGIAHASLVSEQDTFALVKPWLGSDVMVRELPLPRLLDATVSLGAELNVPQLRAPRENPPPP